jgi:hypothetical protein
LLPGDGLCPGRFFEEDLLMEKEKHKNGVFAPNRNQAGAYILIGLGVIFLLTNWLNISWGSVWPLALIALGIFLLYGRTRFSSTVKTGFFDAPLDGAESADMYIHLSVGESTVSALAGSDRLIEAALNYVGEVQFDVSGGQARTVRLQQTSASGIQWLNPANWLNSPDLRWQVGLSPQIPINLELHAGMGKALLDLRRLRLTGLQLHGGMGDVDVRLPEVPAGYDARVQGGMGHIRLDLPPATDLNLDLSGGMGEAEITLPAGSGVRLEARGGIGDVSVPARITRLSGGTGDFELGDSGVWQSTDYDTAPHRITIDYRGGVGSLKLR